MVQAYINYPNERFIIHTDINCSTLRQHQKKNQRIVTINIQTISQELANFESRKYKFCPMAKFNDMWLQIELNDKRYEEETVLHIHELLAKRYSRLKNISKCHTCSE